MMAKFYGAVVLTVLVSLLLTGCSGGNDDPAIGGNQPAVVQVAKGWNLVWSDEFNGDSLDRSKWNIQTGDGTAQGIPGWGNNELQSYQRNNVEVENGHLIITARQESRDGREYTSGRINTDGRFDFKYGRVEASIHAAMNQGMWSAFWMLPSEDTYGTWAAGGEIDIMEVFRRDPTPFNQVAIHYGMAWPLNTFKYHMYPEVDPSDGFHEYALEWDEAELRWFVDGQHIHTIRNSTYWNYYIDEETGAYTEGGDAAPFDQPFHLLINLAVGGNLPGAPEPGSVPDEVRVDYVRVYECTIDSVTGRGCAGFKDFTDPAVVPPLGTRPYIASYDFYVDAPGPLTYPNTEDSLELGLGFWDNGGNLVISQVDSGDRGMVIDMNTRGGGNFNIFAADNSRQMLVGMGSATDGATYAGELVFDLFINSEDTDQAGTLQVKIDSGWPDLGFVELAVSDLPQDEWSTVTVQISDIVKNPSTFDGGGPVDMSNVLSLFVLEASSFGHFQVDNIRLKCAHVDQDSCGIAPPAPPPPATTDPFSVFINEVDPAWDNGIGASDSGSGWQDYFDGTNPENKVQWSVVDSGDPDRGNVIEVTFNGSEHMGVWFIQASMGVDLNAYATGSVNFDIKVDNYGTNEVGMTMKVDCFFPCTSGDQVIGVVGDGEWESIEIPMAQLLGGGLNLSSVNTGIVVFPAIAEQSSAQTFQLDNIQWLPGEPVEPPPAVAELVEVYNDGLAEGWVLWDCCGGATVGEADDGGDRGMVAEISFGATPTVAGFQSAVGRDLSGISEGTLEFDFKEVSPPPEGSQWLLKLESANQGSFVEVLLTAADNPAPGPDWQHYSYTLSGDLAGLDISDVTLIMMFPNWGNADGAVARIDNVRFVPPPAAPVVLFADTLAEGWALWDCCGGATFAEVADDDDHGQAMEITFGAGATVTGIRSEVGMDFSAAANGTLTFDFKEVSPPPDGSLWRLKVESAGGNTPVEVLLTAGGNPPARDQWQSYSYAFDGDLAALDVSNMNIVLWFPDWGNADGAIARIDNVRIVPGN